MTPELRKQLEDRDLVTPLAKIARTGHVSFEELMGMSHAPHIVQVRRAAWAWLHGEGWTFSAIARLWGCHYSTPAFGVRVHEERTDEFQAMVSGT